MSARLAGKAQNINGSADGEDAAGKKHRGILRRRRFRGTELSDSDSAPSIPRNRPLSPTHPATKRKAKGAPTGLNRSPKRTRGPVSRDRNTKHVARGSDHDITMDKRSFHTGSPFLGGRVVRSPSLQTPDTDQASLQAPIAALISHVSATGANPDTDTDSIPSIPRNRPLSPTREGVKRKAKENPAGTDSPPPKRIRQHPTGLKHFRLRRSHIARDGGHAHRYITPARNYRVENDVAGDFKNAQVAEWLRQIHVQGDIVMDNGDLRESSDTEMQYTNNDGSLSVRCVGADDDGTSDAVPVDAAPVDAAPVDAAPVEPFVSRSPSIHSPRVADTECSPGDVLPVNARLLQSLPTQPTGVAADELPIDVQRHCELSMDSCASATDKPADQVSTQALSTPNPAILVPGSEGTPARGILRSPSVESSRIANVDQPVNVLANGEHELFMGACASALEQHTNQVSMPPLSEKAPSAILESKRSERSYEPDPSVPSSGAADEEQGSSTRTRDSASIQSADQTPIPGVSAHAPLTTLTPTGSDGVSEQSISRKSSVESSEIVDNESLIACREHKQIMGTCASVPEQCANQVSTLSVFENSRSVLPSPSVPSSDEQESTNTRGSVSINPVNQTSMHAPGHFIRLSAPDHSASSTQALPMSVFENAASVPRGTENGHNPAISGPLDISLRSRESRLPNGVIDSPSQVWSTKSTSDAIRITSSLPSSHPPPPSNSGGSEIDTGEGMLGRARRHPILDVCDESVSMDNDWPREDKSISPQMEIEGSERTSNGTESVLHSYYLGSQSGIKSGDSDGPREDTTSRNDVDENAAGNVQHALSEQLQASHHDLLATHSNSPVIPVDLMNADEEEFEYIDIDGVSSDSQGRDDSAGEPHIENSDEDIYSDWSGIQKQQAAPMDTEDDELSSNGDSSVEDEDISSEWNGLNEQQTLSMDIGDDERRNKICT
ncbi:hypothetical protein BJ138DRAFT_237021 [Hygrophoropsis aurantiaca]|uniref:Uncharacterized protein n=1 Tax=Hygrophoropsis aurantiaca TaxID=72124 RepID=A0ACB8A804_9AGAM|nr:hypothetical protein BJ138DRAFT_237021 [Hygrophoropsis aurantiaca]